MPNSGTPLIKDLVPSIGSSVQTNSASVAHPAEFLADDAVVRKTLLDQRRIAISAARSAAVTGRQIGLVVDRERLAEIGPNRFPRRIGEASARVRSYRARDRPRAPPPISAIPDKRSRRPAPAASGIPAKVILVPLIKDCGFHSH